VLVTGDLDVQDVEEKESGDPRLQQTLGLVAAFVFGVVLASLVTSRSHAHVSRFRRPTPQLQAIWLSAAILILAAACGTVPAAEAAVAPLIAASMGAVNSTFTRGGEVSVGLTYMTGSLVKAGQLFAARLRGAPQTGWLRYAALWTAISLGSIAGAMSYLIAGLTAIWAAATILGSCAVLVWGRRRFGRPSIEA